MTLAAVQQAFCAYLVDEPNEMSEHVAGEAALGLAVYHNAYRAQLVACLRDSHERTWAWLGDDAFEAAARAHIAAERPSSWTLGDYGGSFADALTTLYPKDAEVAEIAHLDWALRRAFDGADAAPVTADRLAGVDWEHAVLRLSPTLALLSFATNAAAIWSAIASGEPPPAVELLPRSVVIRVWRQDLSPRFATIDAAEAAALDAVAGGATFAELCEVLSRSHGVNTAVERAGVLLGSWLADGLIVAIDDKVKG